MLKLKYISAAALLTLILSQALVAEDGYIVSQQRIIKILPVYQSWSIGDNMTIWEFGFPIYAYIPYGRNMNLSLRTGQATAQGDLIQRVDGLTDTQLSYNYYWENLNTVFNLGLNLPSGKNELSLEEFQTSSILSMDQLDFLVPNFGQGLNISPGFSWAMPISDAIAVGLGAAYQFKGEFKAIKGIASSYNPGDELLFTGGADFRLSPVATISTDLIFTTYFADKMGGKKVFNAGNRFVLSLLFRNYFADNELRVFARYRANAKNSYAVGNAMKESDNISPGNFELSADYIMRFNQKYSLGVTLQGKFFGSTPNSQAINLFGLALDPLIPISNQVKIPLRFKYVAGNYETGMDLSGFEFGAGLLMVF